MNRCFRLEWAMSVLSALALTGCQGAADSADTSSAADAAGRLSGSRRITASPTPTPTSTVEPSGVQQSILQLTQSYRAQNGLGALSLNAKLTLAAQSYAEAMASQGFFSHTGPDGSSPGSRITAAGYAWRTYGENIAYGYSTPDAVMTGWMNSSGHRANILSSSFKDIGIGYALSKDGTAYWVQDFGAQ